MFSDYSNHPRTIDVHVHPDTADPEKIKIFAEACRRNHVQAVILGGTRYGDGDFLTNEQGAEIVAQYPDAFLLGAKLDLWQTADPDEVDKYVKMGAVILKCIYPYFEYDNDVYMPVYERAEKYRIPCLFHTGNYAQCSFDREYRRPMLRNMHPITLDRIARSFQDLPVIMAHLGTTYYRHEAAEYIKHYKNMYFDLAGSGSWGTIEPEEMVKLMNFTIPVHDPRMTGFRKMLIGSDAYFTCPEIIEASQIYHRLIFEKAGVPQEIEDMIRCGSIESMFANIRRP